MIRHVVLLHFKDDATPAQVSALGSGFSEMRTKIPAIRDLHFGPDLQLHDETADYALIIDFEDAEAYRTYVSHPAHVQLMKELSRPILESYTSVQFALP